MSLTKLIFAGLLAAWAGGADAAILWFGGEDTSVVAIGTAVASATNVTNAWNATYARTALVQQNGTSTTDPPANRIQSPTFASTAHLWVHAMAGMNSVATTTNNEQGVLVRSPDGVARILVRQTGTNGQLKVSSRNAAGTIVDLATASANYSSGALTQVDLEIVYTCSGAGGVNMWLNTTQVIAFSGNPCTDSATSLNQVEFASLNNSATALSAGACNGATCWSEIIAADENTLSLHVATLALQSAGNTQGWTPNTLGNVNKAAINDATLISDATGNTLSQWKVPSAAPTGTWGVKSVSIEARLLKSGSGPTQYDWSLRVSNGDYLTGVSNALTTVFGNYRLQRDSSPATGTTWGIGEVYNTSINTMNIGVKSLP